MDASKPRRRATAPVAPVPGPLRHRVVVDGAPLAQRIGERLRHARLAAGLTQKQLAGERYTKAYVSALENGQSKPSMAALNYLADRLGVPASRFLTDEPAQWGRLEVDLALAAGHWQQAIDGYRGLLERTTARESRAELLSGLAEALAGLDQGAAAASAGAEAVQIFASVGRTAEAAIASYWLACGEYQQGNSAESKAILQGVLAQVRAGLRVEPDFQVRLLMAISNTESRDGNHATALGYLEEVRGLSDALDDRRRAAFLYDLAYSYRETGDYEAAIRCGTASLTLFRATQMEVETAALENDLALSYLALGNSDKALELADQSRTRFEKLGARRWLAHVVETQARISLARGAAAAALEFASLALDIANETGNEKAAVSALLTLARAQRASGDTCTAAATCERAAGLARSSSRPGLIREALSEWADLLAACGDHERAFALLREALLAG